MQSLLRCDAGEVADGERRDGFELARPAVALKVQSRMNDFDPLAVDAEVAGHEIGVVAAGGNEPGRSRAVLTDERDRLLAVRSRKCIEEDVIALEIRHDRHAEPAFDLGDQAGEQDVRQRDDFRFDVTGEPIHQPFEFAALMTVLAAEHRDQEVAELGVVGRAAEAFDPTENRRVVEPIAGEPRDRPERGELVEVDVDAAEEDAGGADVVLVGADGGEGGDQQCVVAELDQGGSERVVVQATPAEHARGAGGNGGDAHAVIVPAVVRAATVRERAPAPLRSRLRKNGDYTLGSSHGLRYGRLSIAAASLSPTICSFAGSHDSFRPVRIAMFPRWQTLAERWPVATSATGGLRLLTHSGELAWWFVLS